MELITSASVQADGLIIAHRVRRKGRLALVW
jgi:hypothetical protein